MSRGGPTIRNLKFGDETGLGLRSVVGLGVLFSAHQEIADDAMSLLCRGRSVVGQVLAWEVVQTFLNARFVDAQRRWRRLGKVAALEIGGF